MNNVNQSFGLDMQNMDGRMMDEKEHLTFNSEDTSDIAQQVLDKDQEKRLVALD